MANEIFRELWKYRLDDVGYTTNGGKTSRNVADTS